MAGVAAKMALGKELFNKLVGDTLNKVVDSNGNGQGSKGDDFNVVFEIVITGVLFMTIVFCIVSIVISIYNFVAYMVDIGIDASKQGYNPKKDNDLLREFIDKIYFYERKDSEDQKDLYMTYTQQTIVNLSFMIYFYIFLMLFLTFCISIFLKWTGQPQLLNWGALKSNEQLYMVLILSFISAAHFGIVKMVYLNNFENGVFHPSGVVTNAVHSLDKFLYENTYLSNIAVNENVDDLLIDELMKYILSEKSDMTTMDATKTINTYLILNYLITQSNNTPDVKKNIKDYLITLKNNSGNMRKHNENAGFFYFNNVNQPEILIGDNEKFWIQENVLNHTRNQIEVQRNLKVFILMVNQKVSDINLKISEIDMLTYYIIVFLVALAIIIAMLGATGALTRIFNMVREMWFRSGGGK
jgi:hypothetical protein